MIDQLLHVFKALEQPPADRSKRFDEPAATGALSRKSQDQEGLFADLRTAEVGDSLEDA